MINPNRFDVNQQTVWQVCKERLRKTQDLCRYRSLQPS